MEFRTLRADEIECRVATANKQSGASLLLYKDARADMIILDETVGAENWTRRHTRDNANCIVSIWDEKKSQWIEKEDTGTESNTEKEKGLASDSFKRACVNWGIGRELYTAPFIWVKADKIEWYNKNGKDYPKDRFKVQEIEYDENRNINALTIINQRGEIVYKMGKPIPAASTAKISAAQADEIINLAPQAGVPVVSILKGYNVNSVEDMNAIDAGKTINSLKKRIAGKMSNGQ
mgnify:CR=1 FL=1